MIKVQNLVKRYGNNYALNDVSFEIGEGEIVGLLGPNGAGKSTAMNILTGYLSSTSGEVTINGVDILEDPIAAKKNIGFLPEQPPIYPDMTVEEYLNFVFELKSCTLSREEHLKEIMTVTRIYDVKSRLIKNLSKGYKQRVGREIVKERPGFFDLSIASAILAFVIASGTVVATCFLLVNSGEGAVLDTRVTSLICDAPFILIDIIGMFLGFTYSDVENTFRRK